MTDNLYPADNTGFEDENKKRLLASKDTKTSSDGLNILENTAETELNEEAAAVNVQAKAQTQEAELNLPEELQTSDAEPHEEAAAISVQPDFQTRKTELNEEAAAANVQAKAQTQEAELNLPEKLQTSDAEPHEEAAAISVQPDFQTRKTELNEEATAVNAQTKTQTSEVPPFKEAHNKDGFTDFEVPSLEPKKIEMPKSVLRIDNLHKYFRKKHAVKGVSFSMKQGEVVGLLGPNGAGKTTSFYMIVGFYKPNMGNIYLDDMCLTKLPMYKRARAGISYLPQEASVFRKLSVENNIYSILETRKDLTKKEKLNKLEFLLDEFGITANRFQPAYTLSGGERRRTEIARALAIEPKFLLLDEPFAGIDPIAVHDIKSIVRILAEQGIGILITDHNVRDTLEITDRAYIIGQGSIMEQGSKEDILNSEVARKIYLGEEFRM